MADAIAVFGPLDRVTDANGAVVSGGTVEVYEAGTNTPKTVYTNATLVTALGTSFSTNAGGYPITGGSVQTLVYTGTADYKLIIKDSNGNTLITHDNIRGATAAPTASTTALPTTPVSAKAANYTVLEADQGKLFNVNCTGGTATMTLPSAVTVGDDFRVGFRHVGTANTVPIVALTGQTISHAGKASQAMALTAYGEGVWLVSDGTNWNVDSYTPKLLSGALPHFLVTDRTTSPPGSPTPGARYLINGTPSGAWSTLSFAQHDIAEADGNGSWIGYTPTDGWLAYVADENLMTQFRDTAWVDWTGIIIPTSSILKSAVFSDTKAQNTGGGTPTTTAWTAHTLNTTDANTITGCSLASNQITLAAGTYEIRAAAQFAATNLSAIRFYNVTDASVAIKGMNCSFPSTDNAAGPGTLMGRVTIAAQKVFELQYYAASAGSLGSARNVASETEVYAQVEIIDLTAAVGTA